jgi:acyl-CoA reductase-like NAD-dependent aldehyde dehydrogenase
MILFNIVMWRLRQRLAASALAEFRYLYAGQNCTAVYERFVAGWNFMGTFTTPARFFL